MKVKDFIKELKKFDGNFNVTITDGYRCRVYTLDKAEIKLFKEDDKTVSVDIGIGGCDI